MECEHQALVWKTDPWILATIRATPKHRHGYPARRRVRRTLPDLWLQASEFLAALKTPRLSRPFIGGIFPPDQAARCMVDCQLIVTYHNFSRKNDETDIQKG